MYSYEEALKASEVYFGGDDLAAKVVVDKYLLRDNDGNILEKDPNDSNRRLAREFARVEAKKFKDPLEEDFIFSLLDHYRYIIPQGSLQYGLGNPYQYSSLSNCYVLNSPEDSYAVIMRADEELVQISKRRGGVGLDLSNLRPAGSPTKNSSRTSTGIVSWMRRYSNSISEVGQCLHKNSLVLTKNGLKKIKDVVADDDCVWTANGWSKCISVFNNSYKDLYKITTKSGLSLICSEDHILQTFEDGKLISIKLKDIKIKDDIVLCLGNSD